MRCLTLANALAGKGAKCFFICREHEGNLLKQIRDQGFEAYGLPLRNSKDKSDIDEEGSPPHAAWLGASWQQDAMETSAVLANMSVDWLIVDHYALDMRWEVAMRAACERLMVIDDVADRSHACEVLLDQNLGRKATDYASLVPQTCQLLVGPSYALLRPEFSALRQVSLDRRHNPQLKRLLITMGGVDKDNATGQVLQALKQCELPNDCSIVVLMGACAPWLAEVKRMIGDMPWKTEILINVRDVGRLMLQSDVAIGAAGGTSWERCCLGLPTMMIVLAENQRSAAKFLEENGAAKLLNLDCNLQIQLCLHFNSFVQTPAVLIDMSMSAQDICDGMGTVRVLDALLLA